MTDNSVTITGLNSNILHQFFVISRNEAGTSLPSSIVFVNVSSAAWKGNDKMHGLPTPPHTVTITKRGADFIELAWTTPAISMPDERLKYRYDC